MRKKIWLAMIAALEIIRSFYISSCSAKRLVSTGLFLPTQRDKYVPSLYP
jgi:hypothetical protein